MRTVCAQYKYRPCTDVLLLFTGVQNAPAAYSLLCSYCTHYPGTITLPINVPITVRTPTLIFQTAAFRVQALFKTMARGHRILNTADMREFFNQAASSTMAVSSAKSRMNNIWRPPVHHTAPLKSFAAFDPNPERVDHTNWKRRPSATNGTSYSGTDRPGSH
jgi:hypothetical protein